MGIAHGGYRLFVEGLVLLLLWESLLLAGEWGLLVALADAAN